MVQVALDPAFRRISVEEFLELDLRGVKAELEDGLIYMVAGGNAAHARVSGNVFSYLRVRLRGFRCQPFNSDFAARTGDRTVRFPDVAVYCGDPGSVDNDTRQLLGDPQMVVEVLSPSTSSYDQKVKLEEYRALGGVREILLIDPSREQVRLVTRTGPERWEDHWLAAGDDIPLRSLDVVLPHTEIFARD